MVVENTALWATGNLLEVGERFSLAAIYFFQQGELY